MGSWYEYSVGSNALSALLMERRTVATLSSTTPAHFGVRVEAAFRKGRGFCFFVRRAWRALFQRAYEQAVVLSNDADLVTPVSMVRDELRLPIGVVFPCTNPGRSPVASLRKAATFTRNVHEGALKASLYLNHLTDAVGTFSKPPAW